MQLWAKLRANATAKALALAVISVRRILRGQPDFLGMQLKFHPSCRNLCTPILSKSNSLPKQIHYQTKNNYSFASTHLYTSPPVYPTTPGSMTSPVIFSKSLVVTGLSNTQYSGKLGLGLAVRNSCCIVNVSNVP